MSVPFAIAIYVVIWWTVLFAILPIGVRTQGEDGAIVPGTPASAPTRPRLMRVVLLTTLVSCLVFAQLVAGGALRPHRSAAMARTSADALGAIRRRWNHYGEARRCHPGTCCRDPHFSPLRHVRMDGSR